MPGPAGGRSVARYAVAAVPLVPATLLVVQASSGPAGPAAGRAATQLLVALACLVCGAILGLLLSRIPRALQQARSDDAGRGAASSLTRISGWLVVVLAGLALVESARLLDVLGRLVRAMQPAFGTGEAAGVLAGATLAFFVPWGCLGGYLWTRGSLTAAPRGPDVEAATRQDERRAVQAATAAVRAREQERARLDLEALRLAHHQLIEGGVGADALAGVLRQASPVVLEQIVTMARLQRRATRDWAPRYRTDARAAARMVTLHGRTIPVLRASTAVCPDDARVFGDLGYALKDRPTPDLSGADAALSRAIELAERQGAGTGWYRLNRALSRIRRVTRGHIYEAARAREIDRDICLAEQS